MRKLLFLIATTALLCSCDKITIEENEIAGSYWYETSYYGNYIKNGERHYFDTKGKEGMDGGNSLCWYFGDNGEHISYHIISHVPISYYHTSPYNFDLKAKKMIMGSGVSKIIKFTDSELIVEGRATMGDDTNALIGHRFERIYPKKGAFDNYIPYEELPDEYKNPSN